MIQEIPCATCDIPCENAIGLYRAYHLCEGLPIAKMGLKCPKTGQTIETEIKDVPRC